MNSLFLTLSEFHFIRPWWLLGLLLLLGLWFVRHKTQTDSSIDELVDLHLQAAVVDTPDKQTSSSLPGLIFALMGLLLIAISGPAWQKIPQPLHQLQQGRVLLLSLSKSMDNKDIKPSRLARAKFKLIDLLGSAPGVLTGLVGFAGEAFLVAPLSDDQDTIINLLESLDTNTLPVQGVRAENGLSKAAELLAQVNIDSGEVILVADQVSPLTISAAAKLKRAGVLVSILEIIPINSQAQSALFKNVARAGGGIYTRLTADNKDIERLNKPLNDLLLRARLQTKQSQREVDQWRDMGPYLLIPVLILSSLLFRAGLIAGAMSLFVPLWLMIAWPIPANAFEFENLWKRKAQVQWEAAQAYHDEDYQTALTNFKKDTTANGLYNQGNALARLEQLEAALAAYDQALALNPDFEDAANNRTLVKSALEREQQKQQPNNQKQPQGSEKDKQAEEQQKGQQNSENDEPQKSDDQPEKSQPKQGSENQKSNQKEDQTDEQRELEPEKNDQKSQQQEEVQAKNNPDEGGQEGMQLSEDEQSLQMMLRQVPDDPGALLRRKFAQQYEAQQAEQRK